MFGAHQSSIYGTTFAYTATALTVAAKYQVRETHANELMARHVYTWVLDEEFPDYRKFLDNAEVEPTPITLRSILETRSNSASSE